MVAAGSMLLASVVTADDGLLTRESSYSVGETLERMETAARDKGMTVFARIDHAAGARKVGLELRPTELILFGNPKAGTPLMQSNQTVGIDLPMKALAWEDEQGRVWLTYTDPAFLGRRHRIDDRGALLEKMNAVLADLEAAATGGSRPAPGSPRPAGD
jgi:uncharacterized protein (DUF302 family)